MNTSNQTPAIILIVDDTSQNLDLLEAFLFPQGYTILQAAEGQAALQLLSENPVDLVISDVRMPGINGFELTRRIRALPEFRVLPIILSTALHEIKDRLEGIEAGCDDFIVKPIDKFELLARVRSLLKVKAYHDLLHNYRKELEAEVAIRTEELKQAFDRIKAASLDTIYRLSKASEYKDETTGAHIKRVGNYCAAIARQMGMGESSVETILCAAPMHDVGKIGIPDFILLKKGVLDAEEWKVMQQHTVIGSNILKGSEAEIIRAGEIIALFHHEKWDGTGYPHQIRGADIPLIARITAVADVFDALNSVRPYKPAFTIANALAMIQAGSGTHFDPAVVDAFFAIKDEILAIKSSLDLENQADQD